MLAAANRPAPNADDSLPPDLERLARQLAAEAEGLARRYPPCETPLPTAAPLRRRWLAAAAVLLATGALGLLAALKWSGLGNGTDVEALAHRPQAATSQASGPAQVPVSHSSDPARDAETNVEPLVPVHELSGPEMEAVLDLIEGSQASETNLSI